jgi:hypothetical protein
MLIGQSELPKEFPLAWYIYLGILTYNFASLDIALYVSLLTHSGTLTSI